MLPTPDLSRDGSPVADPHKRLMAAVLQTVVDDCRGSVDRAARWPAPSSNLGVRRAIDYVASRDRVWPFSFENLCEALSLNAGRLRRKLQEEQLQTGDYTRLVEALEDES